MNNKESTVIMSSSAYFNLDRVYPVGSLFFTTSSLNPSELLGGGGEWKRFGEGRVILSSSDSKPNGTTGGSETVTLTVSNIPAHSHSGSIGNYNGNTSTNGNHFHNVRLFSANNDSYTAYLNGALKVRHEWFTGNFKTAGSVRGDLAGGTDDAGNHNHSFNHSHSLSINNTGSSQGFSVMNPFISVNVWERIS